MNSAEFDVNKPILKHLGFANARKETVGETFKHWNKFLKSRSAGKIENFKELVSPSVPLSAFEEKLRLIAIDTFQLKSEVVNILFSQNDFSIKRVLRCKWFFKSLSADFCIKEIFPRVSYSLRFKIINRLSKYLEKEEEAEKLFSYIESNLIFEGGEILLPKCSPDFILNYCKNVRPLLTRWDWKRERILLRICKRYPELGMSILAVNYEYEKRHNHLPLEINREPLLYLAAHHMDLFAPLFKTYYHDFNNYSWVLHKKMAWNFVKKEKDFFLKSSLCNTLVRNMKYIFSNLNTTDRIKCLINALRLKEHKGSLQSWLDMKHELPKWLSVVPSDERYHIITTVFKKVYKLNFRDQTKYWYLELLELIPTKERQYFAEKLEEIFLDSEDKFMESLNDGFCRSQNEIERTYYLYEFPVAFIKFKKLIKKSPVSNRRENIMLFMLKCCKINDDTKGLEEVVDYITENHRHEAQRVVFDFVRNVCEIFSALPLSVNHKLRKLLNFTSARETYDLECIRFLQEKEIYMKLESKKDTEDLIKKFFKSILRSGTTGPFLSNYRSKYSRTLLLKVGKEIKQWIEMNPIDHTSEVLHSTLITTCIEFNNICCKSKRVCLADVPGYAKLLREIYRYKYFNLGVDEWPINVFQTCDVRRLRLNSVNKLLLFFLKKNPELIINHLEAVLELSSVHFYPYLVKYITLLDERDKLKELTLRRFQTDESFYRRRDALFRFAHLCTIKEFTDTIQQYIPEEDHVNEANAREFVLMQLTVPRVIKYVRPRWKNLDLILKYYRGDFLKSVLLSFFATCCHSRIDYILPFLKELIYKIPPKVSYLKSIIRIIYTFSSHKEKISFCVKFWNDHSHYSIRKIIFQFMMKIFLKSPTRELFNIIVGCALESEAEVLAEENYNKMKVPDEYLGEYALALWKASKNFILKDDFRRGLLWNIDIDNIDLFPTEFCEEFIREYLFRPSQNVPLGDFAAFYLVNGQGTLENRVETIFKLMQETKASVHSVRLFFYDLRRQSQSNPARFRIVISMFLKNWPDNKSLYQEKFIYHYYEVLYNALQTSEERKIVSLEFGKQLREFLSDIEDLQDKKMIISYSLMKFLKEIYETKLPFHLLFFCREMIGDSQNNIITEIALSSLPYYLGDTYSLNDDSPDGDEDKMILNEIFQVLEYLNNDIFWVYFWRVFKDSQPAIPN